MDWSSERYVRLYTRDTPEWLCLPWQSRALWPLLLRKSDRAGVIATKLGAKGIAVLCGLPFDVTETGLAGLVEDGCIRTHQLGFVIPNFIEAQEARMDGAERQRKHREARRDMINAGLAPDQRQPVVYFVQSEHGGPVKIGFAEDVARRMVQLQVSRPDKLVLLASMPGSVRDEADMHRRFVHIRERGEWFTDTEELMGFIRSIACDQSHIATVTGHDSSLVTPCCTDPIRTEPSCAEPLIGGQDKPASHQQPAEQASTKAKGKRGVQLPEDWAPRAEEQLWATSNGIDCTAEVAQFSDHHRARGSTFKDWDAAFRTWLRNHLKWRGGRSSSASSGGTRAGDLLERQLERVRQAEQAEQAEQNGLFDD